MPYAEPYPTMQQQQNCGKCIQAILRKLDFTREQFDKEIQYFSGGQKKKVLIAKSLCQPSHLLIWDEPLNYIDVISRMQLGAIIVGIQTNHVICRT